DDLVAEKFAAALRAGLIPVLCVGETLAQRQGGETEAIVTTQLSAVLKAVGIHDLVKGVIAYEPVWAIGTGE
ncbi:triose-phosphate isomerase, partial [Pseudomonas tolaasii]